MLPIRSILRNAGIHPSRLAAALRGWKRYARDRRKFRIMACTEGIQWGREIPMLAEWMESSGSIGAYFIQDQTVARWIFEASPRRHVDVGSRLDGFVGSVSVFREIEVIDIRQPPGAVRNVRFHQMDLMNDLPEEWVSSTDSLSCLHTIEHFGLGRYGDRIDVRGHEKGLNQLMRMVQPGGRLYLSTLMGPERVEFNAHRVFSLATILGWFSTGWRIERFAHLDDHSCLHEVADPNLPDAERNLGCQTGLAILSAVRLSP